MGIKISAIVLTKNDEDNIESCLKGLTWADEIVVIDSSSTDSTVQLAKRFGAKVSIIKDKSFAKLREAGAKEAKGEWLFYVDADEKVTRALKSELINYIKITKF